MASKHDLASQPYLVPMHGGVEKKPRPLDRDVLTIGRARGCDIGLDAPDVSTLHCLIYRGRDGLRLRDCGSRSGIRLNGLPVKNQVLNDGDVVQIGPFSFAVQIPKGHSAEQKPPEWSKALRWDRSRRNLLRLALSLRARLRRALKDPAGAGRHEMERQATELRAKIRQYDLRVSQLEEAERELDQDRGNLDREKERHQAHVQQVETGMTDRLEDADRAIHAKWLEFQQRCKQEEVDHQRRETSAMNEPQINGMVPARLDDDAMEKQRAAWAQAEASLREQRTELARMMDELRDLQESIRSEQSAAAAEAPLQQSAHANSVQERADVAELLRENDELRRLVTEFEERIIASAEPRDAAKELEDLKTENDLLRQMIRAREDQSEQVAAGKVNGVPTPNESPDLESYEAELNRYRKQLETDRTKLNAEIEQLRMRNRELDEATREMEMEMSRERAELARERTRVDSLRDEARVEMERVQRESTVRENLVPVQKLREELNQRKQTNGSLNDRLKNLRSRLTDSV